MMDRKVGEALSVYDDIREFDVYVSRIWDRNRHVTRRINNRIRNLVIDLIKIISEQSDEGHKR